MGAAPQPRSPAPQGLGPVEVPAVRGEEQLVQVSQQQLPGAPGESRQVPGPGRKEPVMAAARHTVSREGREGKERLWLPADRQGKLGEEHSSTKRGPLLT